MKIRMNKTLEVAKYEYMHHVSKRRFWVGLFLLPLGMLVIFGLSILMSAWSIDTSPVGYVDQSGLITLTPEKHADGGLFSEQVQLIGYKSIEEATAAANEGMIQAFVVVPANYLSSYKLEYRFIKPINESIQKEVSNFMRGNLMAGEVVPNLACVQEGPDFISQSLDGSKTNAPNEFLKMFVPMLVGILFFVVVMMSGSYLLQAVVEEKENRTIEVMITSTSPNQLMAGKIIGNISVGLTQLLVWVVMAFIAALIFREKVPWLFELDLSFKNLAVSLLLLMPAFIFTAALMATLGATVTDTEESQQVSGIIILPMTLPYYFMAVFMEHPHGLIAKVLSYFPLSSPVATTLRMAFTNLPAIEIIGILISQVAFAVFSVWLAGKAFKRGMLSYHRRLKLKEIFSKEASHA